MRTIQILQVTATVAGLLALTPAPAAAQDTCQADTCPAGHTCELGSYENCQWECTDNPDGSGECHSTTCETVDYTYCQRAACEADADCGGEMVCHTFTGTSCSAPSSCPPGEDCPMMTGECTSTEYRQCAYTSELPCQVADDCGAGYDCVEAVSCTCMGTAMGATAPAATAVQMAAPDGAMMQSPPPATDPTAPSDAPQDGGVVTPPSDSCSCAPSGVNYCQMQNIPCDGDADCPSSWSCMSSSSTCWVDDQGNTGCGESIAQCYPPSSNGMPPVMGVPATPGSTPPGVPGPTTPAGENAANPDDPSPQPGPGEGSQNTGTTDGASTGPEPGQGHPRGHHGNPVGKLFPMWGCTIDRVGGATSGSFWAVLSLGLGAVLLRRRRH